MSGRIIISVMPAKAGISAGLSARLPQEIPAFAGMTIWGNRHA